MDKAKRLRAQRQAVSQRSATLRRQASAGNGRARIELLQGAVIAIGDAYDTTADCASAGAMLREAARLLGYELRPRAVSAVIQDYKTKSTLIMGRKARERFPAGALARIASHVPEKDIDNGHIVLTSEDPRVLFDANLRQTGAYGVQAPSVMLNIESTSPESGEWVYRDTSQGRDLEVFYILDEDNRILLDALEDVAPSLSQDAATLVYNLKQTANDHELMQMLDELRAQSAEARARRRLR